MPRVVVDLTPFHSPERFRLVREAIGKALYRQSMDRMLKGGDDEITFVPLRFPRPDGSVDHIMNPTGKHLAAHMDYDTDPKSAWVRTEAPGAKTLLLGTVGKSAPGVGQGTEPTIRPIFAKALFIPLSVKAAEMTSRDRNAGIDVAGLRKEIKELRGRLSHKTGDMKVIKQIQDEIKGIQRNKPMRAVHRLAVMQKRKQIAAIKATTGKSVQTALNNRMDKLEKLKEHRTSLGLERGKDFIFASKVDLPPRPYFRVSQSNAAEFAGIVAGAPPKAGV